MEKIRLFIQKHSLLLILSILIAVGMFAVSNSNDLKGELPGQPTADSFFDVFCNTAEDYSRGSFFDVFKDIQLPDNNYSETPLLDNPPVAPLPDSFFDIFYSFSENYLIPAIPGSNLANIFFNIFCGSGNYSVQNFFDIFYNPMLSILIPPTPIPVLLPNSFFDVFCNPENYKPDSLLDIFCKIGVEDGNYPNQFFFYPSNTDDFRINNFFDIFYNIDIGDFGIPAGIDSFSTPVPSTCGEPFSQLDFTSNPLPPGFFGEGSEPFGGTICLQGAEGGPDTMVQRLDDLAFNDPFNGQGDIQIELVQLNLVSCNPITVIVNDQPTLWNVDVSLSDVLPKPQGTMTVNHTCEEGGTFSSEFQVQPVFTFTQVDASGSLIGEPGHPVVRDLQGLDAPTLEFTSSDTCWSHTASDHFYVSGAEDFFPGICHDPCNAVDPVDPNSQSAQLLIYKDNSGKGTLGMLPAQEIPDDCACDSEPADPCGCGDIDGDGIPDNFDNDPDMCNPDQASSYNLNLFFDEFCAATLDGDPLKEEYLSDFCHTSPSSIFDPLCYEQDDEDMLVNTLNEVFCQEPPFNVESFFDITYRSVCPSDDPVINNAICNQDGVPDECNVVEGNNIPDECDTDEDCNFNGIPDECDVAPRESTFAEAYISLPEPRNEFNFFDSFCHFGNFESDSLLDILCNKLSFNNFNNIGDPDFDLIQSTDGVNFDDLLDNDGDDDALSLSYTLSLGSLFGNSITIPAGTTVTTDNGWDGTINPPTQISNDGSADTFLPNPTVIMVEMGSTDDTTPTFNPPVTVKIVLKDTVCNPYGYTMVRKTNGSYSGAGISYVNAEQQGDDCIITFEVSKMSHFAISSSSAPSGGNADLYQGGNGGGGGYYKRRDVRKEQEQALERTLRLSATYKDVFPDYVNGEGRLHALKLFEAGIIKGDEDGSFRPYSSLTRFEVVKIALGLMGEVVTTEGDIDSPFPDVTYNNEMKAYIKKSKELGLVHGYPDGLFRPNQDITRAEAAKILFGTGGGSMRYSNPNTLTFRDVENIEWVKPYLQWGVDNSVLNNDVGYYPNRAITREEAITFAGRIFDLSK